MIDDNRPIEVVQHIVLDARSGFKVSSNIEWISDRELVFVATKPDGDLSTNDRAALYRVRIGSIPNKIADVVVEAYCLLQSDTELLFNRYVDDRQTRVPTVYDIDSGALTEAGDAERARRMLQSCARGDRPSAGQARHPSSPNSQRRVETSGATIDFEQGANGRSIVFRGSETTGNDAAQLSFDWSKAGRLSATDYAIAHNRYDDVTIAYPLLDYEQKQALWKSPDFLDVPGFGARDGRVTTFRVPWLTELSTAWYSISTIGPAVILAVETPMPSSDGKTAGGIWRVRGDSTRPLFEGAVDAASVAPGPEGRLAFVSPAYPADPRQPLTTSIIVLDQAE